MVCNVSSLIIKIAQLPTFEEPVVSETSKFNLINFKVTYGEGNLLEQ